MNSIVEDQFFTPPSTPPSSPSISHRSSEPVSGKVNSAIQQAGPVQVPQHASLKPGDTAAVPREQGVVVEASRCTPAALPSERETIAMVALEESHQVAEQFVEQLRSSVQVKETIACLRAVDVLTYPRSPASAALWARNPGNASQLVIVLNNGAKPLPLFIPNSQEGVSQEGIWIEPTIIPMGVKMVKKDANGQDIIYEAPHKEQSPAENEAVRKLIKKSLECYYGKTLPQSVSTIDNAENIHAPLTVRELASMVSDLNPTLEENIRLMEERDQAAIADFSSLYPQISTSDAKTLITHLDSTQVKAQSENIKELARHADESVTTPEQQLLKALWYSAETVVRSASVPLCATGGGALGTLAGIPMFLQHGFSSPVVDIVGNLVSKGALIGAGAGVGAVITTSTTAPALGAVALGATTGAVMGAAGTAAVATGTAVAGFTIAGAIGGAALGAIKALKYFSPGFAVNKVKESLYYWSGKGAQDALALMKKTQEADEKAIDLLDRLLSDSSSMKDLGQISRAQDEAASSTSSSSEHVDAATRRVSEDQEGQQLMTATAVKTILIEKIREQMAERALLIQSIERKIEFNENKERQRRQKMSTPEYRALHRYGI